MDDLLNQNQIRIGRFRLDLGRRRLYCGDVPVDLGGKALDLLCVLAAANGRVVTKDELMNEVWPGLVVEENNIQVHVSALRKALEAGADGESIIVTVARRGYRLNTVLSEPYPLQGRLGDLPSSHPPATSIAVLAFTNMSGDPEQEYFADGIVEDIITGLSRIRWLFVIARNSSFIYKGKAVDLKQVGRELGCRYVLEGSVRKANSRVRVSAQLIDTHTGINLWGERYDRLLDDVFAVQDEIAMNVIGAIEPSLRKVEIERVKRKRPDSLDAYDLMLRAMPFVHSAMTAGADTAIPLLQKALELEPDYAGAHALLARCFHFRFSRGGQHENDRAASIRHARAAMNGSDDATTLAIAGVVIWFDERDIATAIDLFDRALAISNSNVVALSNSAFVLAWMGKTEQAIERAHRALQLSPFETWNAYMAIAVAEFHAVRYGDAREAARRAVESNPDFSVPHVLLAVALVRLGCIEEARVEARRVLALDPTFTTRRWSVTVGVVDSVFDPFAEAWREIVGLDG
jgi:TolB-like protein/Tfp pilus assembly protein PilF